MEKYKREYKDIPEQYADNTQLFINASCDDLKKDFLETVKAIVNYYGLELRVFSKMENDCLLSICGNAWAVTDFAKNYLKGDKYKKCEEMLPEKLENLKKFYGENYKN